jgi:hypothetical protein
MIFELKPDQERVLDQAVRSGMTPEEVLDQAFAVIQEQYRNEVWMPADREAIAAQIEEGFAQAERGQLTAADLPDLLKGIPPGAWVAISEEQHKAIAFGVDAEAVHSEALQKGEKLPLMVRVPDQNLPMFL